MKEQLRVICNERMCGIQSPSYNYLFNKLNGLTMRWGKAPDDDPFMSPVPELADISISNRCDFGCDFCYRDSQPDGPLMSLEDFEFLLDQIPLTFQLALGGGEPTQHPDIIPILKACSERGMIPNYTTNGSHLTSDIIRASKKYCGAVAVSWSPVAPKAIKKFREADVKTNIHFVVDRSSISEAMSFLDENELFREDGVNAMVFLLHKGVGRASPKDTPSPSETHQLILKAFNSETPVAFDSCFIPHLAEVEKKGDLDLPWHLLDYCDGARFTVYVDEDLNVHPCSFCTHDTFRENLRETPMDEIWHGDRFESFRQILREDPTACPAKL